MSSVIPRRARDEATGPHGLIPAVAATLLLLACGSDARPTARPPIPTAVTAPPAAPATSTPRSDAASSKPALTLPSQLQVTLPPMCRRKDKDGVVRGEVVRWVEVRCGNGDHDSTTDIAFTDITATTFAAFDARSERGRATRVRVTAETLADGWLAVYEYRGGDFQIESIRTIAGQRVACSAVLVQRAHLDALVAVCKSIHD